MTPAHGIYVITGIMASGKSTVAELLAKRFPRGVHVRGDLFRRMVVSGRREMTADYGEEAYEQLLLRCRIAAKTAQMYFEAGFSVAVQDNYLGEVLNRFLEEFTVSPLYLVTLNPSAAAVAAREAARGKKGYTGGWTPQAMHEALNRENPCIGLWLDSGSQTPEETADEIIRRAAEARIR